MKSTWGVTFMADDALRVISVTWTSLLRFRGFIAVFSTEETMDACIVDGSDDCLGMY